MIKIDVTQAHLIILDCDGIRCFLYNLFEKRRKGYLLCSFLTAVEPGNQSGLCAVKRRKRPDGALWRGCHLFQNSLKVT